MHSNYTELRQFADAHHAVLVAVSKTKPATEILELYRMGQRDFGENRVQELCVKADALPGDIRWHMIGHLQKNKVKYIAGFIYMIHSVDSLGLLAEIDKQAQKHNRIIPCLLQMHIAKEETKFGLDESELITLITSETCKAMRHIEVAGLMGMATNTQDTALVRNEFRGLKTLFDKVKQEHFNHIDSFKYLSMGMSSDYIIAVEEGAGIIRIGSLIFGKRN